MNSEVWGTTKILLQVKELGRGQTTSLWITALLLSADKIGFSHMLHWYTSLSPFCQPKAAFLSITLLNPFSVTAQSCAGDIGVACCFLLTLLKSALLPNQISHYMSYLPLLFLLSMWVIKTLTMSKQFKENNKYIFQIPKGITIHPRVRDYLALSTNYPSKYLQITGNWGLQWTVEWLCHLLLW